MRYVLLMLMSFSALAAGKVTAVTNVTGEMTTVSILQGVTTSLYSKCINLTPYTYTWNVNDAVNVSVNAAYNAWTLNDTSTAAIAFCIIKS